MSRKNRCGRCGATGHYRHNCQRDEGQQDPLCADCRKPKKDAKAKLCVSCFRLRVAARKRRPCAVCGVEFEGRSRQKHCSFACADIGKALPSDGTIYALIYEGQTNAVKIGHTTRPVHDRIDALSTSHYLNLVCIAQKPGSRKDERTLHLALSEYRIKREWFRLEGDVAAWVTENAVAPAKAQDSQPATTVANGNIQSANRRRRACLACGKAVLFCNCGALGRPVDLNPGQWIWKGKVRDESSSSRRSSVERAEGLDLYARTRESDPYKRAVATIRVEAVNDSAVACAWPKVCRCKTCDQLQAKRELELEEWLKVSVGA